MRAATRRTDNLILHFADADHRQGAGNVVRTLKGLSAKAFCD